MSANISFQEFRELAETWIKTREMEAPEPPAVPDTDYKKLYFDLVDSLLTPEEPEGPEEVQIDQHTFAPDPDAGIFRPLSVGSADISPRRGESSLQGEGNEGPKPGSWVKRELDRKFKQAVVERIREARKMGIGSEVIAQNSRGRVVTGDTVRQILEAQTVDVRKCRKVDEALDRLGVPKAKEETDEQKEE